MRMDRGNLAIRENVLTGKRLDVFKALGGGRHRFVREFVYQEHDIVPDHPYSEGNLRNSIVFRLRPVKDDPGLDPELQLPALLDVDTLTPTEKQTLATVRV